MYNINGDQLNKYWPYTNAFDYTFWPSIYVCIYVYIDSHIVVLSLGVLGGHFHKEVPSFKNKNVKFDPSRKVEVEKSKCDN